MKVAVKVKSSKRIAPQQPLTKEDVQEAVCRGIVQAGGIISPQKQEPKKVGFWKAVWLIIRGKGSDNSSFATALLAGILSVGFNVLCVLGLFVLIAAIVALVQLIGQLSWTSGYYLGNLVSIAFMTMICLLLFLISIIFRGAANDLMKEKDRNYVVSLFSGIVSFVALVISIIALYRGGC